MGMRVGLAALGVLAAGHMAAWAGPNGSASVYWSDQHVGRRVSAANLTGGPIHLGGRNATRALQIDPSAKSRTQPPSTFEAWYFRRFCHLVERRTAFCQRLAQIRPAPFADSLIRSPDRSTARTLNEVEFPVIQDVPPVAYLERPRHNDFLFPALEPAGEKAMVVEPCRGNCQPYAVILQSETQGGVNIAGVAPMGSNSAVILQSTRGPTWNDALVGQWGALNRALVLQAAGAGNNLAVVNQAGYANNAFVSQH